MMRISFLFCFFVSQPFILIADDDNFIAHHIRKKADQTAQLYLTNDKSLSSMDDRDKSLEYERVRKRAEECWSTLYKGESTKHDQSRFQQRLEMERKLSAITEVASFCMGDKNPQAVPIYSERWQSKNPNSWGQAWSSGKFYVGPKAMFDSTPNLLTTVLHELVHIKQFKLATSIDRTIPRPLSNSPLMELHAEGKALELVRHIYNEGNPASEESARYSKAYLAGEMQKLEKQEEELLKERNHDLYRQSLALSRTGAPGMIYGGIILDASMTDYVCEHGTKYFPEGLAIDEEANGDIVLRIKAQALKDGALCSCARERILSWRPWSREDLWAAWQIVFPTESMKTLSGVEGGEAGLVSMNGSDLDYAMHPAMTLVGIGQNALDLDSALTEVVLDRAPITETEETGERRLYVKAECDCGGLHTSWHFETDKIDDFMHAVQSSHMPQGSLDISSWLDNDDGTVKCRPSLTCSMPFSQMLAFSRNLLGMQWVDSIKSQGIIRADDSIDLDDLDIEASAVLAAAGGGANSLFRAALKIAENPELDAVQTSQALRNVAYITIANDDPGVKKARRLYCFKRVQEFARTLAIVRGLKEVISHQKSEWTWINKVRFDLEAPKVKQGSAAPEVILAEIGRILGVEPGDTMQWLWGETGFVGVGTGEEKANQLLCFIESADPSRILFVHQESGSGDYKTSKITVQEISIDQLEASAISSADQTTRERLPISNGPYANEETLSVDERLWREITREPYAFEEVSQGKNYIFLDSRNLIFRAGSDDEIGIPHRCVLPILIHEVRYQQLWPICKKLNDGESRDLCLLSLSNPLSVQNGFSIIARGMKKSLSANLEQCRLFCVSRSNREFQIHYKDGGKELFSFDQEGQPDLVLASGGSSDGQIIRPISEQDVAEVLMMASSDNRLIKTKMDNRIERSHGPCTIELFYEDSLPNCQPGESLGKLWKVVERRPHSIVIGSSERWAGVLTPPEIGEADFSDIVSVFMNKATSDALDDNTLPDVQSEGHFGKNIRILNTVAEVLEDWTWDVNQPQPCSWSYVNRGRRGVCYHQALLLDGMLARQNIASVRLRGLLHKQGESYGYGHGWVECCGDSSLWRTVDPTNPGLVCVRIPIPEAEGPGPTSAVLLDGKVAESLVHLRGAISQSAAATTLTWKDWCLLGYTSQLVGGAEVKANKVQIYEDDLETFQSLGGGISVADVLRIRTSWLRRDVFSCSTGSIFRDVESHYGTKAGAGFSIGALTALVSLNDDRNRRLRHDQSELSKSELSAEILRSAFRDHESSQYLKNKLLDRIVTLETEFQEHSLSLENLRNQQLDEILHLVQQQVIRR
jgi:hypothetical protein